MHLLSAQEAEGWCGAKGIGTTGALPADRLSFRSGPGQRIRIKVPGPASEVLSLAYVLAMTGVPEDEEEHFPGALVWFQDWDIWSESTEQVGHVLLAGLRSGSKASAEVRARPGHLLGPRELVEAQALISLPLLFQWDAYFVPASGTYFAFASHHGNVDLVSEDQATGTDLLGRFRRGQLSPTIVQGG